MRRGRIRKYLIHSAETRRELWLRHDVLVEKRYLRARAPPRLDVGAEVFLKPEQAPNANVSARTCLRGAGA
jgi:hypothetical protein